ncbi:hypothetical protein [uncultured Tateyamaria sp.]|uniref:FliH/SctL family protein n=1 Tax=uncultured Tateyamaria sp. TaxID=455651 RepID=UPI00261B4E22|nr:hypothetical protein [uncultured Tateyamaria sp.]
MSAAHLFQDFGTIRPTTASKSLLSVEEIEELKLQAFENGYQAGWEDAIKAQSNTLTHVSSGLASSLQAASFEYHELRAAMTASVQTIMTQVTRKILPQAAQQSLGAHIQDVILDAARKNLDRPIELAIATANEEAVRAVLSDNVPAPFEVVADDLMGPTQVVLRLGDREIEVDLDRVVADITNEISTFFETQMPQVTDE